MAGIHLWVQTFKKCDPVFRKNHSPAQSWLQLAPSGICLWVGNVECFESWMDLSSFKIPLWLKEHNIHCLKSPLFVFSAFLVFGAWFCKNIHTQHFAPHTSPHTFSGDLRGMETFLGDCSECSEQIEKVHFNAYAEFYGEGTYFYPWRQTVELTGVWVLELDFQGQSPVFHFSAVTLD